ncbi:MAG: beta-lactamase family protein [Deltaproteobacteria bacterium]|nr:beta-lactamase family protein [Deltaproteobacteria bacterium]
MIERTMRVTLVVVGLAAACGGGKKPVTTAVPVVTVDAGAADAAPAATAKVPARTVASEETLTSASGATFSVSAGWTVADDGGVVILGGPEGDATITYLEVEADSGAHAIDAAWKRVRPGFALEVAQADQAGPRDGWDGLAQITYVTPPAEQRVVIAAALGKGTLWRVFLVDSTQAALSRRGAQLGTTLSSLKAPGVTRTSWAGKQANTLDATRLAAIDAFVEQAMKATDVPGAAIAIVQDGKVVHERGFGVREVGKPAKVSANTLFLTGSTGKSLMTLMMARAVDAGVFTWDTPVTKLLPSFALGDPAVTAALHVRHTVCACTGMPRQDLEMLFEYQGVTPQMRLDAMKTMVPTTRFGETFQYSNLLVMAGGYAAAHALYPALEVGAAFDKAMQTQVFTPLGMTATTYDFKRATRADHATPHARDSAGTMTAIPLGDETWVTTVRPAGGQWSSVHDYARVLLLELGRGQLDGKRLVSEANLLERRKPQVKVSDDLWYGMGLLVGTIHDAPWVTHNGGTAGFTTDYLWLPDHGVGVVIVSNVGGGGLFTSVVRRRIFEELFDGEAQAATDLARDVEQEHKSVTTELARIKTTLDPSWAGPLMGAWTAPGLGRIQLSIVRGAIRLDAGEWQATVAEKVEPDGTRVLTTTSAPFAGVSLTPELRDGAQVLVLRDEQREYVFAKVGK